MDFTHFTLKDWLFVLAPYPLWCLVAGCIWRFILQQRMVRPFVRAAVFSILFTPTLFPIMREVFIVGPASLSLLYVGLIALRSHAPGHGVVMLMLVADLLPMSLVWASYYFGPTAFQRLWQRPGALKR